MWQMLENWLPGLNRDLLEGPPPGHHTSRQASPPDTWKAHHSQTGGDFPGTQLNNAALEQLTLFGTRLERATLQNVRLDQARLTRCPLDRCSLRQSVLRDTHLTLVSLESSTLEGVDLSRSSLHAVSLRDARLTSTDLHGTTLLLCDAMGARLTRVDASGSTWTASSLAFSTLEEVDFSDADLRGTSLRYAHLHDVKLTGAKLEGADFRGVTGLTDVQRTTLLNEGASTLDGLIERTLFKALSRPQTGRSLERADRLARDTALGLRVSFLISLVAIVALLVMRGPLRPETRGPEVSVPTGNIPLSPPADTAVQGTREGIDALRAAIARHYERTKTAGFPRYPLHDELAQNEVDLDGTGPSQEKGVFMPGGIPPNLLTEGEGVTPYCNPVPTQGTLTGDDTDWHYCEETGRVYACGGHTTAPTLSW